MIFVIIIIVGLLGMIGTLWLSSKARALTAMSQESTWYSLSPEKIETRMSALLQNRFREILKTALHWMIGHYRTISRKVTIKQEIKKRVRAFLYEHRHDVTRNPSAVWKQLRDHSDTE